MFIKLLRVRRSAFVLIVTRDSLADATMRSSALRGQVIVTLAPVFGGETLAVVTVAPERSSRVLAMKRPRPRPDLARSSCADRSGVRSHKGRRAGRESPARSRARRPR